MSHPDVVPEAIDIITKYNICSKLTGYTFSAIDNESYENIQYILLCMNYENKAHEMARAKAEWESK